MKIFENSLWSKNLVEVCRQPASASLKFELYNRDDEMKIKLISRMHKVLLLLLIKCKYNFDVEHEAHHE